MKRKLKKYENGGGIGSLLSGLSGSVGAANPLLGAGLGVAGVALPTIMEAFAKPSQYTPIGENKRAFKNGGDIQLSSDAIQVQGNPQVTDGNVRTTPRGSTGKFDHDEIIAQLPDREFALSPNLTNPLTGKTLAKDGTKIKKSQGNAENKIMASRDPEAANAEAMLKLRFNKLVQENLRQLNQISQQSTATNVPRDIRPFQAVPQDTSLAVDQARGAFSNSGSGLSSSRSKSADKLYERAMGGDIPEYENGGGILDKIKGVVAYGDSINRLKREAEWQWYNDQWDRRHKWIKEGSKKYFNDQIKDYQHPAPSILGSKVTPQNLNLRYREDIENLKNIPEYELGNNIEPMSRDTIPQLNRYINFDRLPNRNPLDPENILAGKPAAMFREGYLAGITMPEDLSEPRFNKYELGQGPNASKFLNMGIKTGNREALIDQAPLPNSGTTKSSGKSRSFTAPEGLDVAKFQSFANRNGINLAKDGVFGKNTSSAFERLGDIFYDQENLDLNRPDPMNKFQAPEALSTAGMEETSTIATGLPTVISSPPTAPELQNSFVKGSFRSKVRNALNKGLAKQGDGNFPIGEILQLPGIASRFMGISAVERETPNLLPNRQIDPSSSLRQLRSNLNAQTRGINTGNLNTNRALRQQSFADLNRATTNVLSQTAQQNAALTQQTRQANIQEAARVAQVNAQNRAARDQAKSAAFDSLGNLGRGINKKRTNKKAVQSLLASFPDIAPYLSKELNL